jgi:hypothetical protein
LLLFAADVRPGELWSIGDIIWIGQGAPMRAPRSTRAQQMSLNDYSCRRTTQPHRPM